MDFTIMENMTEEEIENSYEIIVCGCTCKGVYAGDLLFGYCDSGVNYTASCMTACRNKCGSNYICSCSYRTDAFYYGPNCYR